MIHISITLLNLESLSENTYITQINGEFGNGLFKTQNDQRLAFFYSKGQKGYKNLLTNKVLPMDSENLVISSINKTKQNSYAVVFYPMTDHPTKNKTILVLNHVVG